MRRKVSVLKGKTHRCAQTDCRRYIDPHLGKAVTNSMAKHYADNRFQCPSCRADQCKSCKEMPYHLGFNCADFQEHKLKK